MLMRTRLAGTTHTEMSRNDGAESPSASTRAAHLRTNEHQSRIRHRLGKMTSMDETFASVVPEKRRRDAVTLLAMMRDITGEEPVVDRGIIGFGTYHYRYASGHEGDAPAAAFAPRKAAMSIYLADGIAAHADALAQLGPHTSGVGCLYVKDLSLCDLDVLRGVIETSYQAVLDGLFANPAHEP